MKPTDQELKAMFGQTPDSFTLAMERALAGEKPAGSEKPARRLSKTWSIVLIVALALALTAGAYAAAVRMGLVDFVGRGELHDIPQSALDVLQSTEVQTFQAGPVTVSLNQTIADGHLAYIVCQSRMTDGSKVLMINWELGYHVPEELRQALGLEAYEWMADAAANSGLPVYSVETRLEVDEEIYGGEMGLEAFYTGDGSMVTGGMIDTDGLPVGDVIKGNLRVDVHHMRVSDFSLGEYSPHYDMEMLESWTEYFPVEIPVIGVLETKTFKPVGDRDAGRAMLEKIDVERTPAGLYTRLTVTMTDENADVYWGYGLKVQRTEELYEDTWGLYDGGGVAENDYPRIVLSGYISADEMPETLYVLDMHTETVYEFK